MKKGIFFVFFIATISGFSPCAFADVGFSVGFYGPNAGVALSSDPYGTYWTGYGPYYDSPGYYAPYWDAPYLYDQPVVVQRVYERRPIVVNRRSTWTFTNNTDQTVTVRAGNTKVTLSPDDTLSNIPQTRSKEFSIINRSTGLRKKFRSGARDLEIQERNGNLVVKKH